VIEIFISKGDRQSTREYVEGSSISHLSSKARDNATLLFTALTKKSSLLLDAVQSYIAVLEATGLVSSSTSDRSVSISGMRGALPDTYVRNLSLLLTTLQKKQALPVQLTEVNGVAHDAMMMSLIESTRVRTRFVAASLFLMAAREHGLKRIDDNHLRINIRGNDFDSDKTGVYGSYGLISFYGRYFKDELSTRLGIDAVTADNIFSEISSYPLWLQLLLSNFYLRPWISTFRLETGSIKSWDPITRKDLSPLRPVDGYYYFAALPFGRGALRTLTTLNKEWKNSKFPNGVSWMEKTNTSASELTKLRGWNFGSPTDVLMRGPDSFDASFSSFWIDQMSESAFSEKSIASILPSLPDYYAYARNQDKERGINVYSFLRIEV